MIVVRRMHVADLAAAFDGASMGEALARKFSQIREESAWQSLFPAKNLDKDPRSGLLLRHHALANAYQAVVKRGGTGSLLG